jgi:hypothetical protein
MYPPQNDTQYDMLTKKTFTDGNRDPDCHPFPLAKTISQSRYLFETWRCIRQGCDDPANSWKLDKGIHWRAYYIEWFTDAWTASSKRCEWCCEVNHWWRSILLTEQNTPATDSASWCCQEDLEARAWTAEDKLSMDPHKSTTDQKTARITISRQLLTFLSAGCGPALRLNGRRESDTLFLRQSSHSG